MLPANTDRRTLMLVEIATDAEGEPTWKEYVRYCRDRQRGLRQRAFAHLDAFLDEAVRWPASERRRFMQWLGSWMERYPGDFEHAVPHPLAERLVRSELQAWTEAEPTDPRPHRWLGMFFGYSYGGFRTTLGGGAPEAAHLHLRRAIELDPDEQPSRIRLAEILIAGIEWDTHHLPDYYLGDPVEDCADADEAIKLANEVHDPDTRARLCSEIAAARRLVEDWIEFQASGGNDFEEWCRLRGREYRWVQHYYYGG